MAGVLDDFWGMIYSDPGKMSDPYLDRIPQEAAKYYGRYGNPTDILNNPGQVQNADAAGYVASPGYEFNKQQQLAAAQRAASAGGMAGSPQHVQQNMQLASDLAAQDYNNWANRNMDYMKYGFHAADKFADLNTKRLGQKAEFAYNRANAENDRMNALISMLVKAIAGAAVGGPTGAAASVAGPDLFNVIKNMQTPGGS